MDKGKPLKAKAPPKAKVEVTTKAVSDADRNKGGEKPKAAAKKK